MNIYFACSLTGGRKDEPIYGSIVNYLQDQGHEVPTAHLAQPEVMALEHVIDPSEVYTRDIAWIKDCDCVIAEVSTPSHGVGYEIAYALGLGRPVLCCYRVGRPVSKMITGNDSTGLKLGVYRDASEALALIGRFLKSIRVGESEDRGPG